MQSHQPPKDVQAAAQLALEDAGGGGWRLLLSGHWLLTGPVPRAENVLESLPSNLTRIELRDVGLEGWDASLLNFVRNLQAAGSQASFEVQSTDLPAGVGRLLHLARSARDEGAPEARAPGILARIGTGVLTAGRDARTLTEFLGQVMLSLGRLARGRARFRVGDFLVAVQECGPEALGIVSLISFLIGLILAFMGAVQLQMFGAEVYVANLVAVGMAREMGAMMTGIILAGRTGAAYAAQLGTMTVNEEIDALETLGISPVDFLVLPRMLALSLMTPLLTLYSNLLGILGGFFVGVTVLGITPALYWNQTLEAAQVSDFLVGLAKAAVIGVLIAIAGCVRGMRCGRSASAVGLATTSAVVTAIVMIIVSEAVFAVVLETLGI